MESMADLLQFPHMLQGPVPPQRQTQHTDTAADGTTQHSLKLPALFSAGGDEHGLDVAYAACSCSFASSWCSRAAVERKFNFDIKATHHVVDGVGEVGALVQHGERRRAGV